MKTLVILINKILYFVGKIFHKGSSIPGQIALKLDNNVLNKIKLPENVIIVTGSNGKTSTTEMIDNVLTENGLRVGCNKEGSNQIQGVTTMILNSCNLLGVVKKDALVIEADERYLKYITKYIKPKYLVVTNLFRDQMTRNGHPDFIYDVIKNAIPEDTHLILNTDDPLSSLYGFGKNNVTYVGINQCDTDTSINTSVYNDAKYCPNCKHLLKYEYYHFSHIGRYKCENCGHERKNPDFAVTSLNLKNGEMIINDKYKINMVLKSFYNSYNLVLAFAAAKLIGVDEDKIVSVLNKYIIQNDRVQTFKVGEKQGMLLTSKHENSISYNQSLKYVLNQGEDCTVVIIVDSISRKYFTSETSWLWDIDFELLKSDIVKKVIIAGKYVHDLSVRFKYADIDKDKIISTEDLDEMMNQLKNTENNKFYVITCFADRMKFIKRV